MKTTAADSGRVIDRFEVTKKKEKKKFYIHTVRNS